MTEPWRRMQVENVEYFEESTYRPPYRQWWSGLIALRNKPFRSDHRGIIKNATVRLREGSQGVPVMISDQPFNRTVGYVARVWDKDEDEIWGQLFIEQAHLIAEKAPLWPQIEASTYELDGPAGWFKSLDIGAIVLGGKPVWEELKEVAIPQ